MKKLILITGAPGVGKTTLCRELFKSIQGCAWLDSDWCWMINPWIPKTDDQKQFVEENFSRILRGYLENENITTVLFCWLMSNEYMFNLITNSLSDIKLDIRKIALVCDREEHIHRMKLDGRRDEQANFPDSMDKYRNACTNVIDVTNLSVLEIVARALEITYSND